MTRCSTSQEPIRNHELALLSKISLNTILALVALKILFVVLAINIEFRLTAIALIASIPILVGSPKRMKILKHIDWATLVFFAAMFVLIESVWQSGFFQQVLEEMHLDLSSPGMILAVSVVGSQFVSNVPLVALFQPILLHAGVAVRELMALTAGSTIAGNMFILGAASNVIVIQNAEKKSHQTVTFLDFARVGIPLTVANTLVYWIFLRIW